MPAKKHYEKVLLRATIQETDGSIGDVRNATITFMEGSTVLCGPLPVSLQNGNLANGVASCTVVLGIGMHDIDIVVGGYYTGEPKTRSSRSPSRTTRTSRPQARP